MKYYLVITGMTVGSLTSIVVADGVKSMIGEPEYIKPVNPKLFWARSETAMKKTKGKIKVLEDLGYQKDHTFSSRGLIKILFGYLPVAK